MAKRSRLKFYLKLLATLAIIVGVYWSYIALRNYYYEKQLAEILARLDANEPGWEWEGRFNKIPKLKKDENAGEEIKAIMRLLTLDEYRGKLGRNEWSFGFDGFETSRSEEAIREFLRDHPNAVIPKDHRETMAKLVSTGPCPEALQRARKLNQFPAGTIPHTYRPFLAMSLLPDVQSARNLVRLFAWNASLEMAANRPEQAANEISAMLQIARVFDHDPFNICVLVRSAIVQMTCHATQRLLAQTSQTSPGTLKRLQEQFLREESLMISLPEAYRWERALHDHDLKLLHSGEYTISAFLELQGNMFVSGPLITRWAWLDSLLKKVYPTIVLGFWAEPRHFARERADLLRHYDKVIAWAASPEHQLMENYKTMTEQGPGVSPFVFRIHNYGGTMES